MWNKSAFIEKVELDFPEFYQIHLKDGRVIGISSDCVVLYESADDVYEGGLKDRQTIDLCKKGVTA